MRLKNCFTVLALLFTSSSAFAFTTCPTISATAYCSNGEWHLENVSTDDMKWVITGEGATGKPCNSNQSTTKVRWNYAASFARLSAVMCNYSMIDQTDRVIGPVQFKSYEYKHTGDNWVDGGYPGYYKCDVSQDACLFK